MRHSGGVENSGYPPPGAPQQAVMPQPVATRPQSRPTPIWVKMLFWFSVGLIFLAALVAVADWAARNIEMTRLLTAIEASENQMKIAQEGIATEIPDDSDESDLKRNQDLKATAAAGRDEVAQAGAEVASVSFLPWHDEMIAAQGAYLAHNQAWVEYLADGAEDPATMFDGQDNIEPTWIRAESEIRQAVPVFAWPQMSSRINVIFSDSEAGGAVVPAAYPSVIVVSAQLG